MQEDFHYYATYCAAFLAGFSHAESLDICYSAQLVDLCSATFLARIGAPQIAATTQLQLEMMEARTDLLGLQNITRIWASFHFLPKDLYAKKEKRNKRYMNKYRLICGPNGDLVVDTVKNAKDTSLQHIGIAMHVLADTWAHMYFAGTPSQVINNTDRDFFEILTENGERIEKRISFRHSPSTPDDLEKCLYTNTLHQGNENSVMNLGHGRAGHFPDYSFARYRYYPSWNEYRDVYKDNPKDYMSAFLQMVTAMKYLKGKSEDFEKEVYDTDVHTKYGDRITEILEKRQLNACEDWKEFGTELSREEIPAFDLAKYQNEYIKADKDAKKGTFIGKFIDGALAQKTMVSNKIYQSGNMLAGFSRFETRNKL